MTNLGGIDHDNEIIDRKVKAFYDYFYYYLSRDEFIVIEEQQALDNHLSILEKIDFRLKETKIERSSMDIINYLKENSLLDVKNDLISKKHQNKISDIKSALQDLSEETIQKALKEVHNILNSNDKNTQKLKKYLDQVLKLLEKMKIEHLKDIFLLDEEKGLTSIKTTLEALLEETIQKARKAIEEARNTLNGDDYENTKYLEYCIDQVVNCVSCQCEIEKKEEEIKYYTKLIVVEFVKRNFYPIELIRLFDKILSKDLNIFPFPPEIYLIEDSEIEIAKEKFLKNINIKERFRGISNYLNNAQRKSTFIVKILNADCDNIDINYDSSRIFTANHFNGNTDNLNKISKSIFEKFITSENCVFIEKELEYKSLENAVAQIMANAENAVSYLNYLSYPNQNNTGYTNPRKGVISKNEYICLSNNQVSRQAWKDKKLDLSNNENTKYDLDDIELDPKLREKVLKLDTLYFRAFTSISPEDKIFNAWRYIEVLLKDKKDDKKRVECFVNLLLTNEELFQKESIEMLIFNLICNNRYEIKLKIEDSQLNEILKQIFLGKNIADNLNIIRNNTDYKFIHNLIDKHQNSNIKYKEKYDIYKFIINTLYEQRNYVVHQDSICQISLDVFIRQIQILLQRVRKEFLERIRDCKSESWKNIVDIWEEESKQLKQSPQLGK